MMELISQLLTGLTTVMTVSGISMLIIGVLIGIIIGALPGMNPAMGVALIVPLTYGMDPSAAFILFVATYQAANYGGSITAIAINTPGTPSSAVTAIDGFALTKKGHPEKALGAALIASTVGGLIGGIILVLFAIPIAQVALAFGPAEYCMLAVFGLSTVVAFQPENWKKGCIGIVLGLLLSMVIADPFTGDIRFSGEIYELYDGISFIPALIGLFAFAEILTYFLFPESESDSKSEVTATPFLPFKSIKTFPAAFLRSSLIGTLIGIIPGAGATIASFISYGQGKRFSKEAELFGKGSEEGIIASEAANSSSVGGALIPLLSLGIPGSATDAVLLGALTLHGLVAGPELFVKNPEIVYGIFVSLLLANFLIFFFGWTGNRIWLAVIKIPSSRLVPIILVLCLLGSYASRGSSFDMWICFLFGILGCFLKRAGYQPATVVLGLVLGGMIEVNYRRTLLMGDYSLFYTRPVSALFLGLTILSFVMPVIRTFKKSKPNTSE